MIAPQGKEILSILGANQFSLTKLESFVTNKCDFLFSLWPPSAQTTLLTHPGCQDQNKLDPATPTRCQNAVLNNA
jgi:hypothetical protein